MNRPRKDYRVYLHDIISSIDKIGAYTKGGKEAFFGDEKTQDAVIRQLSIIGEATAKLPLAMKAGHKEIPWKDIISMRNIIIHDYSETDLPAVWDTVKYDLPSLKTAVEVILEEAAEL